MSLKLGDTFPNLSMKTTWGNLNLYDYLGESWVICHILPPLIQILGYSLLAPSWLHASLHDRAWSCSKVRTRIQRNEHEAHRTFYWSDRWPRRLDQRYSRIQQAPRRLSISADLRRPNNRYSTWHAWSRRAWRHCKFYQWILVFIISGNASDSKSCIRHWPRSQTETLPSLPSNHRTQLWRNYSSYQISPINCPPQSCHSSKLEIWWQVQTPVIYPAFNTVFSGAWLSHL